MQLDQNENKNLGRSPYFQIRHKCVKSQDLPQEISRLGRHFLLDENVI